MSDALFDLDPEGNASQLQRIRGNAKDVPPEAGAFDNFVPAVGSHTMRAAANVGRTTATLVAAPLVAVEKLTQSDNYSGNDNPLSGPVFKAIDDYFNPAVDYWTPDAAKTGTASRIVGGLVESLAPLTLGPVGVPAMLGNAQVGTSTDLMRQGVDSDTSLKVGLTAAGSTAVGFKMPFLGNSLATRMASGAGGNLAVNSAAALVQNQTLDGKGYTEAAKQFDPTDKEARAIDFFMGTIFGMFPQTSAPKPNSAQGDAVLAARNAKKFQQDSAPGVPKDVAASASHQANMEQAMLQLMRGEKVDLASTIKEADFIKPPMAETQSAIAVREAVLSMHPLAKDYPGAIASIAGKVKTEADMKKAAALTESEVIRGNIEQRSDASLEELKREIKRTKDPAALAILNDELAKVTEARAKSGNVATPQELAKLMPLDVNLTPKQRSIEAGLRDTIANDYTGAKARYAAIPETDGGRIINTDLARELSPEYQADRTQSAAVHEPASWFTKELYANKLAELPKGSDVVFTAGGTGAGKTSALDGIPIMETAKRNAGLVYDTNMNGMKSSLLKVEQALDSGHNVKVMLVDRDPVDALVNGALSRAMHSGRTVPLNEHFKTHRDVHGVMRELQKRYGDNPRFSLEVVDNTRGNAQGSGVQSGDGTSPDKPSLGQKPTPAAKAGDLARTLKESIDKTVDPTMRGPLYETEAKRLLDSASGMENMPEIAQRYRDASEILSSWSKTSSLPDNPEVNAMRQLAETDSGAMIIDGYDADGNPKYTSVRDAVAQIEADHADQVKETKSYNTAINCFLRRGG